MTWERLETRKPTKDKFPSDRVDCASIGGPGGGVAVALYFGAGIAAELGIADQAPVTCYVERGFDTFFGELKVQLSETGNRRIAKIGGTNVYRLVMPAWWFGVKDKGERDIVKARKGPNGEIYITLPKWARKYNGRSA